MLRFSKRDSSSDYIQSVVKAVEKHPSLKKIFDKEVPFLGRKLLASTLSDETKLNILKYMHPEKTETLRYGLDTLKKANRFGKQYMQPNGEEAKELYSLYRHSGGEKRKRNQSLINKKKKNANYTKRYRVT